MGKQEQLVKKIKELLKKDTRGLTIQEIADLTNVSRITANIALVRLESSGVIDVRKIGNCKLHYLKAHSMPITHRASRGIKNGHRRENG
ncbi:HTH domain-containing protein [Candidatus Pacearchaeota archaeon]|nr:HTH domain-containing protein [Candidatus Pacearchaeota archaeon]